MRHAFALIPLTLLLAAASAAQPTPQQGPCAGDIARFCADVGAGGGRVLRCLRKHGAQLSADCRDMLSGMGHRAGPGRGPRAAMTACRADARKYCADVQSGRGRIRECLQQHLDEVTEECKIALMAAGRRGRAAAGTPGAARVPPTAAATP